MDLYIFYAFCALIVLFGLWFFKYGRTKNFSQYALGCTHNIILQYGSMMTPIVTGTVFITAIEQGYTTGFLSMIAMMFGSYSYILSTRFFMRGLVRRTVYPHRYGWDRTTYEWAGREYNSNLIRTIGATAEFVGRLGALTGCFISIFKVLQGVIGFEQETATLIGVAICSVIILYAALGGMRIIAVINTVFMGIFLFALICIFVLAIIKTPSHVNLNDIVAASPHISMTPHLKTAGGIFLVLGTWLKYVMPDVYNVEFQRIKMMNNHLNRARNGMVISAFTNFGMKIIAFYIVLHTLNFNNKLTVSEVFPYVLNRFCPVGVKGLIGVAILGTGVSYMVSLLNSQAILFTNDILPGFLRNKKKYVPSVITSFIVSIVLGGLSLFIAIEVNDIFSVVMKCCSFYGPVVSVPMMCLFYNVRSHKTTVLSAMAAGAIARIICLIFPMDSLVAYFFGILSNAIVYFIVEASIRHREYKDYMRKVNDPSLREKIPTITEMNAKRGKQKPLFPEHELAYDDFDSFEKEEDTEEEKS